MSFQESIRTAVIEAIKAFSATSFDTVLADRVSDTEKLQYKPSQTYVAISKGIRSTLWEGEGCARSTYAFQVLINSSKHRDIADTTDTVAQGVTNALRNRNHAAGGFAAQLATADTGANWLGKGYKIELSPFDSFTTPDGGTTRITYNLRIELSHVWPLAE